MISSEQLMDVVFDVTAELCGLTNEEVRARNEARQMMPPFAPEDVVGAMEARGIPGDVYGGHTAAVCEKIANGLGLPPETIFGYGGPWISLVMLSFLEAGLRQGRSEATALLDESLNVPVLTDEQLHELAVERDLDYSEDEDDDLPF